MWAREESSHEATMNEATFWRSKNWEEVRGILNSIQGGKKKKYFRSHEIRMGLRKKRRSRRGRRTEAEEAFGREHESRTLCPKLRN